VSCYNRDSDTVINLDGRFYRKMTDEEVVEHNWTPKFCVGCPKCNGKIFLQQVRDIIQLTSRYQLRNDGTNVAQVTAFSILVMLDGSGEQSGTHRFRVVTEDGEPVEFGHHDL